jgi:hypothetical protein
MRFVILVVAGCVARDDSREAYSTQTGPNGTSANETVLRAFPIDAAMEQEMRTARQGVLLLPVVFRGRSPIAEGVGRANPGATDTSGRGARHFHGIESFHQAGFDGYTPSGSEVVMAFIDGGFNSNHIGLRDRSGAQRTYGKYHCVDDEGCATLSSSGQFPWWSQDHGSWVVGSGVASLNHGLDTSLSSWQANKRTYIAPDAGLYLIGNASETIFHVDDAVASMAKAETLPVDIVSQSQGWKKGWDGYECDPYEPGPLTAAADSIYTSGRAYFAPAGNEFDPDDACELRDTAFAPGSFTVGSWGPAKGQCSSTSIKDEMDFDPASSEGGVDLVVHSMGSDFTVPRARSAVDMLAVGCSNKTLNSDGPDEENNDGNRGYSVSGQTSMATPKVAAAAAVFTHWYEDTFDEPIGDPGRLYASMLLFGDGWAGLDTPPMNSGFHPRAGAGRLVMPDLVHDDITLGVTTVTLTDGESIEIPIGDGRLPVSLDEVSATLWWYEPNAVQWEADSQGSADIVMQLVTRTDTESCTGGSRRTMASDWSYDTKKRVVSDSSGLADNCAAVKLTAYGVPQVCSNNPWTGPICIGARQVHVAWMHR